MEHYPAAMTTVGVAAGILRFAAVNNKRLQWNWTFERGRDPNAGGRQCA